jgi:hypothetical protein
MIRVKVTTDAKTGQLVQHFKTKSGAKFRVLGQLTPRVNDMRLLGEFAVAIIKGRVSKGIGSDDAPMKPLSMFQRSRWSKKQQRYVKYGNPINPGKDHRDLRGPGADGFGPWAKGHMLDAFSVRSVSEREVRMDITTAWARGKARVNEIRSPWFGWSVNDLKNLTVAAESIFHQKITDIAVMLGLQGSRGNKPIWMNPWAAIAPHSADARWAAALRSKIAAGPVNRRRR